MNNIRNFCIIAHIDHGKSTLADRLLEVTNTVAKREMKEQLLDTMDIERERGITIKLQPVRMHYQFQGQEYELNLIDTPGHVDFSYEVSRSLAAVEGAILLVDAAQGIEAQTLANLYMAMEHNLTIIPVVNKIDLPSAEPEKVSEEIVKLLGISKDEIIFASGKTGQGVNEILAAVIERTPAPKIDPSNELKALIFDSIFDPYRGVIAYVRITSGALKAHQKIRMIQVKSETDVIEVGYFSPTLKPSNTICAGQIGYIITGFKDVSLARVGDTVTLESDQNVAALEGYRQVKPLVYAGIFSVDANQYPELREALGKLKLNDAALIYEPEVSEALGFGFRCGFLGLLHMEIVKERLEREYNLDLIATSPSVSYQITINKQADGVESTIIIHTPSELPEVTKIAEIAEPWAVVEIVLPKSNIGAVMEMAGNKRGIYVNLDYLDEDRAILKYQLPISELIVDFYDRLKSITSGYGSMNYEMLEYRTGDLVKLNILVGGEEVDSLSQIVHRSTAIEKGRIILAKLKTLIPRQLFEVMLQAAIGGKIIAREDIPAVGKNVTAKLYGGDVTRKNKLLDKQKAGKKRLKRIGKVDIPTEVFLKLLKN
ncbi:MAG: translation elongation factor 4 [Patescibacteria group bacterium]|jgi:GTP-binding protein LepA